MKELTIQLTETETEYDKLLKIKKQMNEMNRHYEMDSMDSMDSIETVIGLALDEYSDVVQRRHNLVFK